VAKVRPNFLEIPKHVRRCLAIGVRDHSQILRVNLDPVLCVGERRTKQAERQKSYEKAFHGWFRRVPGSSPADAITKGRDAFGGLLRESQAESSKQEALLAGEVEKLESATESGAMTKACTEPENRLSGWTWTGKSQSDHRG